MIDRASADDVMSLVSDRVDPPMQVGAVLLLDVGDESDGAGLTEALRGRLTSIPRLRQRLIEVPVGWGRPVWVDHAGFEFEQHVDVVRCPGPITDDAVLDFAAERLTTRLPRERPLWAASLLIGAGDGRAALILVFHHVLADGIAGLAILGQLGDGAEQVTATDFPRPPPSRIGLARDAAASRVNAVRRLPTLTRRLAGAVVELGPSLRTRATPCSLLRPTGKHRQLRSAHVDLDQVVRLAHENGATVNDVILAAITGALHRVLAARGEHVPAFVVSIPVSARPQAALGQLGNQSGVVPVLLPATGTFVARLALIAEVTRAAKRHQRGASTALLGPIFRVLAAAGIYQHFINHQRSIHTFVSNLRGPATRITLFGHPVTGIIPLAVGTGNVTVSFTALSYAGRLVITVSADPGACPDLDRLQQELRRQLLGVESLVRNGDQSPA